MGWFLMFLALLANFTVERVSTILSSAGLIIAIIVVLQFPPRLLFAGVAGVRIVADGLDAVEGPQPRQHGTGTPTPHDQKPQAAHNRENVAKPAEVGERTVESVPQS